MQMTYVLIITGWGLYGAIHSLLAAQRIRQYVQQAVMPARYYRLIYNLIAAITFLPLLYLLRFTPVDPMPLMQPVAWFGNGLILTGTVLGVLALRHYNLAEFIGWPATDPQPAGPASLRRQGLLAYVRHPLYTATYIALAGLFIRQPDMKHLLFCLGGMIYIRTGIYFEEKKLIREFGSEYLLYRKEVPMLFPLRGL